MSRAELANERDRAEWLQCLAAAASMASGEHSGNHVLGLADLLYAEFRKRCGE